MALRDEVERDVDDHVLQAADEPSIPTIAPISRCRAVRMTLIIRSVPMLPDPMIATFIVPISYSPSEVQVIEPSPVLQRYCQSRNW